MFRGLFLDLDDTLFDRAGAFAAWARGQAMVQLGRPLDAEEIDDLIAFDRGGHRARTEFAEDARQLGLTVDPDAFPFQLAEHVVPEGAREVIEELARSRRVAIITNGGPAQRSKLARIGLDPIVRMVLVSGELGIAKPSPAIFERALAWSELQPHEVLMVGDQPVIDLAPAAALGMATAWRRRAASSWPAELAPPTFTIDRIDQLVELC